MAESNPASIDTKKIFIRGNLRANFIQSLFPKVCTEVMICTDHVMGFADIVDGVVIELKAPGTWKFKSVSQKKGESDFIWRARVIGDECPDYVLQLMTYMYFLNISEGLLVFIDENFNILEFDVGLDPNVVEDEFERLDEYWDKKELPAAVPRLYKGKECNYCQFKDKCQGSIF